MNTYTINSGRITIHKADAPAGKAFWTVDHVTGLQIPSNWRCNVCGRHTPTRIEAHAVTCECGRELKTAVSHVR